MPLMKIMREVQFGTKTPEKALEDILKLFNLIDAEENAKHALLVDIRAFNRGEYTPGEAEHEIRALVRSIRQEIQEKLAKQHQRITKKTPT